VGSNPTLRTKSPTIDRRTEEELIGVIGELLFKLHDVVSKKRPHPPLATKEGEC